MVLTSFLSGVSIGISTYEGHTNDDIEVLGVNLSVLGEVEVLLCDQNALCGDRVSACPYMQQSRENV